MRKRWTAAILMMGLGGSWEGTSRAADHQDGAQVKSDPASDINDLLVWMSDDGAKVYLAMTVYPNAGSAAMGAKFSDVTRYVFHTTASPSLNAPAADKNNIICTFDVSQKITCWVVGQDGTTVTDYVTGDASNTAGLDSARMRLKVFAGLRADPFFFNLDGFKDATAFVHTNASTFQAQFDTYGCPQLTQKQSTDTVGLLTHTNMGTAPPVDHFATFNTLAIVIAVDKTLLASTANPIVSVWASTNK